ncbi:MAG: hypothetical protein BMS9Abin07_0296 [Acidimicrobiia bacterium]|nr:MAG: hypothetical protein BMS9Abin07_0296 [Acidimicrobiia bacterium]
MANPDSDPLPRTPTLAADATASAETAPDPGPRWERHDRTHLEVTVRYPVSEDLTWEAFYFLPESFRLDATTYSKRELFADFRSYVRFTIPQLELERVPEEARELAGRFSSGPPDDVVRELKLFASRVRLAITEAAQAIIDAATPEGGSRVAALVGAFVTAGGEALTTIRDVLVPLERGDREVAKTAAWVDEYLSRILETALIDLANVVGAGDGSEGVLGATTAAAVDEARYRRSRKAGPVSSADGSIHDLEKIERRQHSLKRFTSSVLWLDVHIRDGYALALHIFHALAAGIAMAFAVVLAVLFGQPNVPGRLGVWVAVVIVAYMGKDRLKAILQSVFDSLVATRLPDRRWTVNQPGSSSVLAEVAERAGFVDREDLPEQVETMRKDAFRNRLQELGGPESILRHTKTVTMRTAAMETNAPEFASLTDVMRVDVSRWLTHTDDATRTVTLADPDAGELFESKLPRAYDITVVYRLAAKDALEAEWRVARIVVSRNGIRRVALLNGA